MESPYSGDAPVDIVHNIAEQCECVPVQTEPLLEVEVEA